MILRAPPIQVKVNETINKGQILNFINKLNAWDLNLENF